MRDRLATYGLTLGLALTLGLLLAGFDLDFLRVTNLPEPVGFLFIAAESALFATVLIRLAEHASVAMRRGEPRHWRKPIAIGLGAYVGLSLVSLVLLAPFGGGPNPVVWMLSFPFALRNAIACMAFERLCMN